jgi:eukaryotic-like serine/threonine-protein kinase
MLAGRYRLLHLLGTSLMAEVHAADDLELDRAVVVKLLAVQGDRARFEREARAAAALAHPNIVQLFDYGEDDRRPYIVFEYLEGKTLEQRLRSDGPLADGLTARVATDLAAGLAHAHERGVIHRDLKPSNVLFDVEDRAKIADFGIAHLRAADTITDAGTVLGTAAYISPEQVRGEAVTGASDVYSFGVVLYRMVSGRLPFESDSPTELAAMHRDIDPPPLDAIRPDAPADLVSLAMAALAKSPSARPPDGAALLRALATPAAVRDITEETVVKHADGPPRRLVPTPLAAAVAVTLLTAAGVLTAAVLTHEPASAPGTPIPTVRTPRASQPATTQTGNSSSLPTETSAKRTTSVPAVAPTTMTPATGEPATTGATTSATTTETAASSTAETTSIP